MSRALSRVLRLLVVDDSDEDYTLAARMLRNANVMLRGRRIDTPEALVSALEDEEWDLCLLDWVIPLLTTPEVMRILAASRQPTLPCIVWSGNSDPKVEYIAREVLGARAFLSKSEMERLPEIVATIWKPEATH